MIDRVQIERVLVRLRQIESELSDPTLGADQDAMRKRFREHAALRKLDGVAREYFTLQGRVAEAREILKAPDTDADIRELAENELAELSPRLPEAERRVRMALLTPDPTEARNAVLEIRAGTGGEEAGLFVGDLFRMYSRFAENRGWKINAIDSSPSDIGGYKEIVCMVVGDGAYGALRYESGGHRVQRVPVTEAQGRIHTSAATVAVFPESDIEDDIHIPPAELRVDIFCASGPGGQGVNTTYSAIRITHLPSGMTAQSQDERSQHRNKEKAMTVLKARILDHHRRQEADRKGLTRRSLIGSGDRSQRIRTYNFPQNRLTDHRINLTLYSLDRIINGELEPLITPLREHDIEQRLHDELALAGSDKTHHVDD